MDVSIDDSVPQVLSNSNYNISESSIPNKLATKPLTGLNSSTLKSENIVPLNVLTPFFNSWTIRGRVTIKTNLKTYSNKNGEGKLFSFDVCDESGEIRITAFNAECDKYFDLIQKDKVYLIAKGSVKSANKKFSSLNNDYEITLNSNSVIEESPTVDDNDLIPKLRFSFTSLSELVNSPARTLLDVIGVIRTVSLPETLVSKRTQKELIKKEVTFVDKSLTEAQVTLWNELAENFEGQIGQIVALKGVMVGDFRGKTLSTVSNTLISIEPDIPETLVLRTWYNNQGSQSNFTSLGKSINNSSVNNSQRFISQINFKLVTDATGPVYSSINGVIQSTNRSNNHLYKACAKDGCQKKVTDNNDGYYSCSKCNETSISFKWRLMLSVQVSDPTGSIWLTLFQENGEKLLGKSTEELAELYERNHDEYLHVVSTIRFKGCYFRIGSRSEEYNNEQRVRSSVFQLYPHTPVDRAKRLMPFIDSLTEQLNG